MFSSRNKKNIMWIPPLICNYDSNIKLYDMSPFYMYVHLKKSLYNYYKCTKHSDLIFCTHIGSVELDIKNIIDLYIN